MSRRGHIPERRCIGCGRRRPRPELERFAARPEADGVRLVRDERSRLPGRGAYVCPDAACFARAASGRGFERATRLPALIIDPALAPVAPNSEDRR